MDLIGRWWCCPAARLRLHSTSPVVHPKMPATPSTMPAAARAGWLMGAWSSATTAPCAGGGREATAAETCPSPLPAGWPACCTLPSGWAAAVPVPATAASVALLLAVSLLAGMGGGRAAKEPPTPGSGRAGREKSGCHKPKRSYVRALSRPCCLREQ